jgi:hypothetical protein
MANNDEKGIRKASEKGVRNVIQMSQVRIIVYLSCYLNTFIAK